MMQVKMRVSYNSQSNKKRKNELFAKPKFRFKGSKNQVSFNNDVANSIGAVSEGLSQKHEIEINMQKNSQ